ncbi:hypothetical protein M378DRAFT_570650 [Amanita muscaria Koide BX008]|uniref:Uncharacterized protein n=1 Tax=Amanita muscaria (strain Koide BX008) TaxID=946122 RepID=A0A0C2X5X4_AMAMK|nr:hypothetical protein M378DRAFT_570650 [Amanita muscaria Koide BX008]
MTSSSTRYLPAIFFGLYSASFIHCVRWLMFEDEGWRIRKKIHWWLVTATLLVFFLSTALFCGVAMTIFESNASSIISPAVFLASNLLDSSAIQWSILMVIDSVMIYRCWIVFLKNRSIVYFPVVLWCLCLTCETLSCYCELARLIPPNVIMPDPIQNMCLTSQYIAWTPKGFYMCNIVINIYATSALVYKIWRAASTNRLYRICRILTESGILYTLSSLICLISWILSYPIYGWDLQYMAPAALLFIAPFGFQIVLCLLMFIPGIAFNLIIIRVGEQRAKGEDTWVDYRDASNALMPSELLNHCADMSTQGEMGQDSHERMDEGGAMEINETDAGEIMEVDRTRDLEGQS